MGRDGMLCRGWRYYLVSCMFRMIPIMESKSSSYFIGRSDLNSREVGHVSF